jgi:hypothetical protein
MSRGYTGWDVLDPTSPLLQPTAKRHKYGAKKTVVDGWTFDSQRESERYRELLLRGQAGEIADLELQPRFDIVINGAKVCTVRLDFQYFDLGTQQWTVEDVKGMDLPIGRLKRRMVAAQYGVIVQVVK